MYSKGSSWNIWDFHLHTPCSVLNNQFGSPTEDETWDKYISAIEERAKEKGVVAIAITDYFTIEGYKRVRAFKKAGRLNDVVVLPNIEFRVDKFIFRGKDNTDPKRVNLHVILSPEIDPVKIEENFLHDLDFAYENDPFEPGKTRKLKPANLNEFGEKLQAQHAKFQGRSSFEVGCMNAIVEMDKIKIPLDNHFRGKYLIVLADENLNLINWDGQDHGTRKHLIEMAHAFFSSNEKTRSFGLGQTHPSPQSFVEEFKSLKPCIWGCDSHGYDERFLEPDQKRFCWIKGEATWEGLKQILYEPEERVRIQENCPEPDKSIYTIDKVEAAQTKINDMLYINDFQFSLNPNLVTIIGGRGSGKTALLDLVAACFQEGEKLSELEASFYHRLYGESDAKTSQINQPVPVRLAFRSGELFSKQVGLDEEVFEKANIIYLTQNHFDEFSANPDRLNERVIDLVFEKYLDDRRKYAEMIGEIDELEQKIQNINLEIAQLRVEIHGQKEIEQSAQKIEQGKRDDYDSRISDMEQRQGGRNEEIVNLTQQLEKLKARRRIVESLLYNLAELVDDLQSFEARYAQAVSTINNDFSILSDEVDVKSLPAEIDGIKGIQDLISRNVIALGVANTTVTTLIQEKTQEVDELEGANKVIADLRQGLSEVLVEIQAIQTRIEGIIVKEDRIVRLDQERFDIYATIMAKMIALRIFLQAMIGRFEAGKDEMLSRLKFTAVIDMRKSWEFIGSLAEKVDNRSYSEENLRQGFVLIFDQMNDLMNADNPDADFTAVTGSIRGFVESLRRKRSVSESEFYNTVLHRFFSIGLRIEFNHKALSELSMGERAIVLLKILLALDDKPLLIDQPEEHLDNRYIYDELTPAFRSAKKRRQIIVATHNANLVVNTDAEQIIIAEPINGTLSYRAGTLENLAARESIKTILEGGDEAFKKREEKYGYKY